MPAGMGFVMRTFNYYVLARPREEVKGLRCRHGYTLVFLERPLELLDGPTAEAMAITQFLNSSSTSSAQSEVTSNAHDYTADVTARSARALT